MNATPIIIETTLCESDRQLLLEVKANQEKILQLLSGGDPAKNWLTTQQACKRLNCCKATLYNWRSRGFVVFDNSRKRYLEESIIKRAHELHLNNLHKHPFSQSYAASSDKAIPPES